MASAGAAYHSNVRFAHVGDAHVGANSNLVAGAITCNDDGFFKQMGLRRCVWYASIQRE